MKTIHYWGSVLAGWLLLAATGCTSALDDVSDGNPFGPGAGGETSKETRIIEMKVNNKLVTGGTATKADGDIALNAENEITAMDIYVFASEEEFGDYTFQEKLSYRAGQEGEAVEGATPFILVTDDSDNAYSSAKLPVKKGLFVKLYCVANATELYKLNEEGSAYELATLQALEMELVDDQMTVKTEGTPEEDFLADFTVRPINPTNLEDILKAPLMMAGSLAGCINLSDYTDNSLVNTGIKLTRGVARFDVENKTAETRLLIESVSMTQGNATTALFPLEGRPAAGGSLITYPQKFFPGGAAEKINTGLQEAAFYSYAAPKEGCLLLTGQYTTPGGESIPVKYEVPFDNLEDGEGHQITIQANHRYTVKITEAGEYEVKLTIKVADWEEGGNLDDYNPVDANGMSFNGISFNDNFHNFSNGTSPYTKHAIRTYNAAVTGTGQGNITFYSNSDVSIRVAYAGGGRDHDWLSFGTPTKTVVNSTYANQYAFTATVKKMNDYVYPPATVVIQNTTGAMMTLEVHPRELYQGSAYSQAYRFGHDGKFFLVAHAHSTDYDYQENWDMAMTRCREAEGWRLPSFNDMRQLFKMYEWDTKPYLHPGSDDFLTAFRNGSSYSYDATPVAGQFGYNGDNVIANGSYQYYAFDYGEYYWLTDVNPTNADQRARVYVSSTTSMTFQFDGKTSGRTVRCIKDWN